jgi:hypothetical protein
MTFYAFTGAAEAALHWTQQDAEPATNVLWFLKTPQEAWSVDELTDLATRVYDAFTTDLGDGAWTDQHTANNCTLDRVSTRDYAASDGPESGHTETTAGGADTPQANNGLTFCFTLKTGHSGRASQGKFYYPCMPESFISTSESSAADPSNLSAAVSSMNLIQAHLAGFAVGSNTANWIVAHRRSKAAIDGGNPYGFLATPTAKDVINVSYGDIFLDFQKRRAPGH